MLLSSSSFLLPTTIASRRKKGRNNSSKRNEVKCFSYASHSSSFSPFKCPTCAKPLTKHSMALRCPNEHSIDIAREGFAHLLTTRTVTGDTREMVQSRKQFLDSKTFDFLFEEKLKREVLEAVSRCLESEEKEENADDEKSNGIKSSNSEKSEKTQHHPEDGNANSGFKVGPRRKKLEAKKRARAEQALEMKNNKRKEEEEAEEVVFVTIADIGCGDGYWLEKISRWLVFGENDEVVSLRERARKRNVRFRFIGIDASKEAVRVAAKRMMITTTANEDERILEEKVNGAEFFFAVADANDVPMEDDSVDISLSVFAPRNGKEIERTMKEKGTFLVVSPSPLHLQELRSNEAKERGVICLNIEDNKSERVEKQLKELTSLAPIESSSRSYSNSSSEIIERAVPMSSQDVQLLLKMGASGFHQTDASLNAARNYWISNNTVAKTSASASAERGGGEGVGVHEEPPHRKVTLSFHVRAFSKQK
ncbi:unnamed protein product [Bathycoccus prasinos]